MSPTPPSSVVSSRRRTRRRRTLVALGSVVVLLGISWLLLPRPTLYPAGISWSRVVRDRHGTLVHLSTAADGRYRVRCSLAEISPDWTQATLIKEDRWFYQHPGVNPIALIRATWGALTGRDAGGASTLTMQVARLRWGLETRNPMGKLVQIFRAIQLERHYSKTEILEAYFNLAPYGGNVEGATAAAWLWCGRAPAEITPREAIALSVIPQSPATRHPGRGRDTQRIAIAQARLAGLLEQRIGLRADPLAASFVLTPPGPPPHEAPHLCRRLLNDSPSPTVSATLDLAFQHELEQAITSHLRRTRETGIVNACAILVHAPTREVLAYPGSAEYADRAIHGMVDGLRARRSPGSALKPFVYGLALDQGIIHPHSLLIDGPIVFNDYNPENFEREFMGPIHARDALVRSRNIPAVALANRLGDGGLYRLLKRGGVVLTKPVDYYGLALTLGGLGISPVQLATLYSALATDGVARPLRYALGDEPDHSASTLSGPRPLLGPAARFLTLDMLRGAGELGPEYAFARTDPAVAWKTGTSHGFRDAWTVGVRGEYVVVVWLGNFDGRSNNALVARRCAAPLLFDIFRRLKLPLTTTPAPPSVGKVSLCAVSGDLPGPDCTHTLTGWFIPGVSPISHCQLHRSILVDPASGLRVAQDDGRPGLRREIHEFWPPDLLELFRKAGLPRRPPPAPEHGTDTLLGLDHGQPPVITSPLKGRTYQLEEPSTTVEVQLKARATPGVNQLYWFNGEAFLGACAPSAHLPWQAPPGDHRLHVLVDHGRAAEPILRVRPGDR
ncbi:MAG: penicillin-binding protein 1C [Akkermansiaceae bacterium]|nr:penicillin-binding protein 1C [Akkermansiaceae bacterium]